MEEKEKKEVINNAHDAIDKVSDILNVDGNNAKDYVTKLDESDLNFLKELESIVKMFKKPFWKFVLGIIIVGSLLNIFYIIGYFIGHLLGKMYINKLHFFIGHLLGKM